MQQRSERVSFLVSADQLRAIYRGLIAIIVAQLRLD